MYHFLAVLGLKWTKEAVLRIVGSTLGAHSLVGCLWGWTPVLGVIGGWVARQWVGPPFGIIVPWTASNQFPCIARLCSRACLPGSSTKPFQYMAWRCSWTCSFEPNGYVVGLFAATDRNFWTLLWPCRCIGLGFPSGHDLRDLD